MNSRSKIFMTKLCSLTHIVHASNSTCRWSFNTPLEDESKIQRGAGQDFPSPKISENFVASCRALLRCSASASQDLNLPEPVMWAIKVPPWARTEDGSGLLKSRRVVQFTMSIASAP